MKYTVVCLAALTVAGAILRVYGLADALNHDEAYTVNMLAPKPYLYILTHYPLPNNHPLHTVLVRLSVQLLGESEWVTRLPAYLAGVAAIPTLYLLVRSIVGSATAALVGAAMLTLMPVHISYSSTARGYSLAMLLCALALLSAWRALGGGISWWVAYACASLLAVYTLPSVALFCAALAVWSVLYSSVDGRGQLRPACAANAALLAGMFFAYWPIRQELQTAASQFGLAIDAGREQFAPPRVETARELGYKGKGLGIQDLGEFGGEPAVGTDLHAVCSSRQSSASWERCRRHYKI